MKQTNSVLLSEAPVEVDVTTYESREEGPDYKPELCKLFEDLNATEDRGSATHNYSRDEFEDSRLTSAQSVKSDNGNEEDEDRNDLEDDASSSSPKNINIAKDSKEGQNTKSMEEEKTGDGGGIKGDNSIEEDDRKDDMIKFFSPGPVTRGFDQIRPHVNTRSRFDLGAVADPFDSPKSADMSLDALPVVDSNNRLNFVQTPKPQGDQSKVEKSGEDDAKEYVASHHTLSDNEKSMNENLVQHRPNTSPTKNEPLESEKNVKMPTQVSQDEDDSTSDFMETLTMEEDTQDASIASDSKGMSSCEHAVNLK